MSSPVKAARLVGVLAVGLAVGCSQSASPSPAQPRRAAASVTARPASATPAASAAGPAAAPPPAAPKPALRDAPAEGTAPWETIEPEEAGFDRTRLERFVEAAKASESSTLLVLKDGKIVVERYFGQPLRAIETMSMTKSVMSIAIGILVADKKIASVDVPLSKFFPDFAKGKKAKITLRHVLTHISGLAHAPGAGAMTKEKDFTRYARSRDVESDPGTTFSYNNEAVQRLAGVVEKAAGKPADVYLAERLFRPLGISDFRWAHDRAGNVQAFSGLSLHARDLAKLGVLFANDGAWSEKQLLPAAWVRESTTPAQPNAPVGYLWWMRSFRGAPSAFAADGWLGQQLLVVPSLGIVVVRQHEAPAGVAQDDAYNKRVAWFEMRSMLEGALVGAASQPAEK